VESSTQDILVQMSDICDFIDEIASQTLQSLSTLPSKDVPEVDSLLSTMSSEAMLVHCDLGISRSRLLLSHISCANAMRGEKMLQPSLRQRDTSNQEQILPESFKYGSKPDIKYGTMPSKRFRSLHTKHFWMTEQRF
jgi:hypothetical protein